MLGDPELTPAAHEPPRKAAGATSPQPPALKTDRRLPQAAPVRARTVGQSALRLPTTYPNGRSQPLHLLVTTPTSRPQGSPARP